MRIKIRQPNLSTLVNENFDIFISYHRNPDEHEARTLCYALERKGYKVFFDHDSIHDGNYRQAINNAIEAASAFILFFSDDSLERCNDKNDEVRKEVEYAISLEKKIIPVSTENKCKYPDSLPESMDCLRAIHITKLGEGGGYDWSVNELIKYRIAKVVQKTNLNDMEYNGMNAISTFGTISNFIIPTKVICLLILALTAIVVIYLLK